MLPCEKPLFHTPFECPLLADSVEKVGYPKLPDH
jgi:hypothetical protein